MLKLISALVFGFKKKWYYSRNLSEISQFWKIREVIKMIWLKSLEMTFLYKAQIWICGDSFVVFNVKKDY